LNHPGPAPASLWRRADPGTVALVLARWAALLILAMLSLPGAPPAGARMAKPEAAAFAETPNARVRPADFYPWVRPAAPPAPIQAGPVWTAPKKKRGGFLTRLSTPLSDPFFSASSHSNASSSFYGADWQAKNITGREGAFLQVRREEGRGPPFTGAEMQSFGKYGYGRYETVMQPARGSGLVSAFFTYTGPWFGDPHEEIDIEFLGSDTTRVHFNYFSNGRAIKPATFDLAFDAADRPRLYAFDWRPEAITWYVEGKPVYATATSDAGVPSSPGKIMFSAWTGKKHMEGWHGPRTFRDGAGARFSCVSFTPMGHEGPRCSDTYQTGAGSGGTAASGLR